MSLIRPMFKASVAQALSDGLLEVNEQDFPSGLVSKSSFKRIRKLSDGAFALVEEPLEGRITVYIMPHRSMEFGSLGSVSFPYPLVKVSNGKVSMPTDKEEIEQYNAMVGIARARAQAVVQMWHDITIVAHNYLKDRKITSYDNLQAPKSGLQIARDYRDAVMESTKTQLEILRSQTRVIKMLEEAIDSDGKESKLGWASAELMPFTFARAQSRLDAISFGEGAVYANIEDIDLRYAYSNAEQAAYKNAYLWASKNLLQDRVYNPVSKEGDGAGLINRLIAGYFVGSMSNEGILSTTLARLKQADPMVVLNDFGSKCYTTAAAISVGSAALSWVPKFGSALSAISTNPFLVMGMSILWAVGVTLKYVLPFTVVVMWLWALIKWSATVIYVLTGAPLWAVAHLAPEGSGFAGESAREGYFTLLDLALRPVLLVIGIIASMSLWAVLTELYLILIAKIINSYSASSGNGVIGEITLSCIVMIIFAGAYAKVFSVCINAGPALVMKMRGRSGATLDAGDDDGSHLTAVAGVATAKGASMIGGAAGALNSTSQGAKSLYEKYQQGKGSVNNGNDSANKTTQDRIPTIAKDEG